MRVVSPPFPLSSASDSEYHPSYVRDGRVRSAFLARQRRRQQYQLMNRLRSMVPHAQQAVTQLELLQYIIDYIHELQEQLADDSTDKEETSASAPRESDQSVTDLSQRFSRISTGAMNNSKDL